MALEPTLDQLDLRTSVRGFLADLDESAPRRAWCDLVGFGITEIPFPDRFGGASGRLGDAALVSVELGRALSSMPFLSSVGLAGLTLLHAHGSPDAAREELTALVRGRSIGALVGLRAFAPPEVELRTGAGGPRLHGTHVAVLGAHDADVLVVVAAGPHGPVVTVVSATAENVSVTSLTSLDESRPLSRVTLGGVEAGPILDVDDEGLRRARTCGLILLAAEQVGLAQRCVEWSVEHARTRRQFDRAIGSFQAVKHRIADMHLRTELAVSALQGAVEAWEGDDGGSEQIALAAHIAQVCAADAATFASAEAIQVHGGLGFTWEMPLHRYFRRAVTLSQLAGGRGRHLREVTRLSRPEDAEAG